VSPKDDDAAALLEPPGTPAERDEGSSAAGTEEETARTAETVAGRPADAAVHIVQKGESLSGIAQMHGVSWLSLAAVNGIKPPGIIYVGQRLRIPTGSEDEDAPAPAGQVLHEVREGENLYRIGRAYGVHWERIARANGIADPATLYAGQVLKIPARHEGPGP
jgi:LysM repeat protein